MVTLAVPSIPESKAPTGFTQVSATRVTDSSGNLVSNATIYFQPCDNFGHWLSYCVAGNGQAIWQNVSTNVVNGAFSIVLADTALTNPKGIYFHVTILDNQTGTDLLGPAYFIQPTGPSWDFDTFAPVIPGIPQPLELTPTSDIFSISSALPSNAQFTLSHTPTVNTPVCLYYNGVLQLPGIHFTNAGATITLLFPTKPGDNLFASYFYELSLTL